jgi:hypothetical protein
MLTTPIETPEKEEETGCLSESEGTHVRDFPSTSRMLTTPIETPEKEEETGCLSASEGTHVREPSPSTSLMNDNDKLPCKCYISVIGKRMLVRLTPILGKNECPNAVSSKINGNVFVMAPMFPNSFFTSKLRICQMRKHFVIYLMTEESLLNPIQTFSKPLNSELLNKMIREDGLAFLSDFVYGVHEKNPHTIIHGFS